MTLEIKTNVLQEMMTKAIRGASSNRLIPITGLIGIELKKNKLTLTTTDATNTLKVTADKIDGEDFYVVLQCDVFSKLVSKTSSQTIKLTLTENSLLVKGNGTYNIELPLDEEGKLIKFPEYSFDSKAKKSKFNLSSIKPMLLSNKAALAETLEIPSLTGYMFADNIITTDAYKVCCNESKVFNKKVLLPAEVIELMGVMTDEQVTVQHSGNKLLLTTSNVIIYGVELDGIEDYPTDAVNEYLTTEFESHCNLHKATLLNVLDRLSLFVATYDENSIYLTFNETGVIISSKRNNGTELILYKSVENFKPFTCAINIELLKSQLIPQETDYFELYFGNDSAIKLVSGKTTQIISLLEDDRTGEENGESQTA